MESPLALYRRYRPETFQEVIGQDHVTEPLRAALAANRVNHAYLFSGPRGCGKTTSARILARALNCAQAPIADPCGDCDSCRDLARGGPGSIDVIDRPVRDALLSFALGLPEAWIPPRSTASAGKPWTPVSLPNPSRP